MESNKLLLSVLKLHFRNRPAVADIIVKMMETYATSSRTYSEYEKTLKTIHDLLTGLPPMIRVYFLIGLPLPKCEGDSFQNSSLTKLVQKSRTLLPPDMPLVLGSYLSKLEPKANSTTWNTINAEPVPSPEPTNEIKQKPLAQKCQSLLDITIAYIVGNHNELEQIYRNARSEVTSLAEQTAYLQCTKAISKKCNLLEMIERGEVASKTIQEWYPNCSRTSSCDDVPQEFKKAITSYINRNLN